MQDTRQIIIEAIAEEVGCEPIEVTPTKTIDDLGGDSLDVCAIELQLEETFDLKDDLEFNIATTVQQVFDSVEKVAQHKR